MRKVYVLALLALLCLGTSAFADTIFDLSPTNGTTSRDAGNGTGQGVIVDTTQTINNMEFFLDAPDGANLKFFIYNGTNDSLLFLNSSSVGPIANQTWVSSPDFSYTLQAGNTYYFGIIGDAHLDIGYIFPTISYSNNGLTAVETGNSNYSGFGVPIFSGNGSAEIGLRLDTTTVPEPGSIALLGSGVLGLAGVLRRKLML